MKQCNKCGVDLIVNENWRAGFKRNYTYMCKSCVNKGTKPTGRKTVYTKEERAQRLQEKRLKLRNSIDAGIYCWKNNEGKIVYIGESRHPADRKFQHGRSPFASRLEGCTFEMMEYIDNERQRKIREFELIYTYEPILNYPYREEK